ncbi:hypothetical protein RhiirA5_413071 [Rhizophagus irregularis]|uniref:Uncharacterized protein n=1 Tax=Rhizophagus irregularis TaxID=588596 RepID=A0A2N0PXC1_9GLOM|nr:hypothetical protein RhiirA5_413071 [Rhizophagus irregularis]
MIWTLCVALNYRNNKENKIKKCNFIYPTIDIQQRNYPCLYPLGAIPCVECTMARDDNAHVGLCIEHSNDIIMILIESAYDLYDLIIANSDNIPVALSDTIESLPLFNVAFNGYLLIHHLVLIDKLIWARRATLVKAWERNLSITKNKKRFYRRRYKKNNLISPPLDNMDTLSPLRRNYTHR